MANNINIVITAEDKASKPIRSISNEMDSASGSSSKFKSALGSLGGALKTVAIAGGVTALAFGTAGAAIGFGFNSSVEQAQTKLQAFMQDNERVAKTLQWVKEEAAKTQFSFTDMADAAATLTPVSKSSGVALEDLVRQAEILAALNPAEGLNGAVFSLREALSGDWVSIMDRFNIPRKRINELKDQGVPAMEIISKTLGEMGINYDLVAKQGQTVSARFEQVQDKLTMMAGAASKPIFDRVSSELDNLADFDFNGLGEQLAGVVSGGIKAFDDFIPKVQELGKQIGDYLGPKLVALWTTVQDKLGPVLSRLWEEVIKPLAAEIGTTLVGAIGALMDAANFLLPILTNVVTWMLDNKATVLAFGAAILGIGAAMKIGAFVTDFKSSLSEAKTAVDNLTTAIGGTDTKLTKFAGWGVFGIAAATALGVVLDDVAKVNRELDGLNAGFEERMASTAELKKQWQDGVITKEEYVKALNEAYEADKKATASATETAKKYDTVRWALESLPFGIGGAIRANNQANDLRGHASGTNASAGGWRVVGEHGPELRQMGQGDQVMPAYRSRQASMGGGSTVVIQNYNSYNERDDNRFFRDLGFALELAS